MNRNLQVTITDLMRWVEGAMSLDNELVIIKIEHDPKPQKKKYQWVQIDAFSVILCLRGTMSITINSQDYTVNRQAFIDIFDFQAVKNVSVSPDFKGYHIVLAREFMNEVMSGIKRIPISSFLSRCNNPMMELSAQEANLLHQYMENVMRNITQKDHLYQRDMVKNEVRNFFTEILNIIGQRNIPIEDDSLKSKDEIITQFIHLLNMHCKHQHSVSFYAQELCIQPKYLSRILKAVSGKTANQFIDQAIITQAKILLKEQNLTVIEIADTLHFSDQSSFGKFFKKHTQLSPLNFRRGAGGG